MAAVSHQTLNGGAVTWRQYIKGSLHCRKEKTSSTKLFRNSSAEEGPKAGVTPWERPREDFDDVKEGLSKGLDPRANTEPC